MLKKGRVDIIRNQYQHFMRPLVNMNEQVYIFRVGEAKYSLTSKGNRLLNLLVIFCLFQYRLLITYTKRLELDKFITDMY